VGIAADKAWRILNTAEQIYSADTVSEAVRRLAREISARLQDCNPLVLTVMRGSVVFTGQLLPQLRFPLEFDYLDVRRYGDATSGGALVWKVDSATPVHGRTVLVVDDILDEGHTLQSIRDKLLAAGAQQVCIAVFADKETGRPKPVAADFVGIKLPNRYVFGFGMDVSGAWRNLPAIYALKEGEIEG
jgi:hypoxanthine phosphoribosyltransferase